MRHRRIAMGLALAFGLALAGCLVVGDSIIWWGDGRADLIVYNSSDCDLLVYVDGRYEVRLDENEMEVIEDIDEGDHIIEAYYERNSDLVLVKRRHIHIDDNEDRYVNIDEC
ncbi:MAG: hypothetical protein HYV63_34425 [Candidatus Schekmanbacteria bacterium]|nr:hypothetical protein [Candidatus Schekmanbacteria bacterium]